ncbi:MAG: nucleotidyltransferase family protein [Trueperaceae bacterium]|nr:nucleotidyltransferase family protein [Trueperaceae bacterium]
MLRTNAQPQVAPLTDFLLGDAASEPTLEVLAATGLVGHAFTRLPHHPQRAQLRHGFVLLAARHVAARRAVAELLKAWNAAGLTPFVFKGFHLAEFVYPAPGLRGYADVDMVLAEEDVPIACTVAAAAGWGVAWQTGQRDDLFALHGPEYRGHEAAHLTHVEFDLKVDLHHRIVHNVHNRLPPEPVTRRLTEAALAAAETLAWEGARLRVPCPVDAAVFGLALNRCWGSDGWRVKPRDYADFEVLAERHGVNREAVMARAASLGVAHTVGVFVDRCDPHLRRLNLGAPLWWTLRRWEMGSWHERGAVDPLRAWMGVRELVRGAVTLARVLPVVVDTRRRLRRGLDPSASPVAAGVDPARGSVGALAWRRLRRAIHRSLRLLRVDPDERERLTVLSAYRLLRSMGVPVAFETDPARAVEAPTLTLDGRPVRMTVADQGAE